MTQHIMSANVATSWAQVPGSRSHVHGVCMGGDKRQSWTLYKTFHKKMSACAGSQCQLSWAQTNCLVSLSPIGWNFETSSFQKWMAMKLNWHLGSTLQIDFSCNGQMDLKDQWLDMPLAEEKHLNKTGHVRPLFYHPTLLTPSIALTLGSDRHYGL